MWQFLIVTGNLRTSHPAKHQVTLPLTGDNKAEARGLRQKVPDHSEEQA